MNSYVFIGPTISKAEAQSWLPAVYLPPVSQGDIVSLLPKRPKIVGIIDGYFERVPSVWHKEILLAMAEGVHVVGGASLGALRAAELYPFGMVGVGQIFEWYRSGYIEADDEVAVRHAPAGHGYRPTGEALVNIRRTLQAARDEALITASTLEALLQIGRQTHYTERSYEGLLNQALAAGLAEQEILELKEYLVDHRIDQKKLDAIALLQYLARLAEDGQPLTVDFELQYTSKLARLIDKDLCLGLFDGIRLTADTLINHVRLESDDFIGLNERTAANKRLLKLGRQQKVVVSPAERRQIVGQFRAERQLNNGPELERWKERNHLTGAEFEQLMSGWALIKKMQTLTAERNPHPGKTEQAWPGPEGGHRAGPAGPNNRDFIRQLRWEGTYETMVETAIAKERHFLELSPAEVARVDETELYRAFLQQKRLALSPHLAQGAEELGFSEREIFILTLTKYYFYQQR